MKDPSQDVQVLIVDDNPLIRDLMCHGMESHCEVISASDGADALLKSVDNPPDLIISDFRMPGLDGRQLFEKLRSRENTRNIPFVFVASRGDIEEKLRPAVGGGVEDFIVKPFFVADLVRQVKKIVDRLHLEKMQKHAVAPRRDSGPPRRDERHRADAIARNGAEILPPDACATAGKNPSFTLSPDNASTPNWAARKATRSPIRPWLARRRIRNRIRRDHGPHDNDAFHHGPVDGSHAPDGRSQSERAKLALVAQHLSLLLCANVPSPRGKISRMKWSPTG